MKYSVIKDRVEKLKQVQDSLKSKNIDLLIVFAPGKATFYSEYLPDKYLENRKDSTNYKLFCSELKKLQLNFIDLNAWFLKIKNKAQYPLFSKWGTHWSYYGMSLGADTIVKYIKKIRHMNMADFDYQEVELSSSLKHPDDDVEELLNLYYPLPHAPMPYPKLSYPDSISKHKPSVLVIGDSYWGCIDGTGIPKNVFKQDIFWSYFKDEYINHIKQKIRVSRLNKKEIIELQEVIIIEATEENYDTFPYGVTDSVNVLFSKPAKQK